MLYGVMRVIYGLGWVFLSLFVGGQKCVIVGLLAFPMTNRKVLGGPIVSCVPYVYQKVIYFWFLVLDYFLSFFILVMEVYSSIPSVSIPYGVSSLPLPVRVPSFCSTVSSSKL